MNWRGKRWFICRLFGALLTRNRIPYRTQCICDKMQHHILWTERHRIRCVNSCVHRYTCKKNMKGRECLVVSKNKKVRAAAHSTYYIRRCYNMHRRQAGKSSILDTISSVMVKTMGAIFRGGREERRGALSLAKPILHCTLNFSQRHLPLYEGGCEKASSSTH